MPHITLPDALPGIVAPMTQYPETAKHLNALAEALLRGPSSLTPGERETIATCVSGGNETVFCEKSHAAAARVLMGEQAPLVDLALRNPEHPDLSEKMRALLAIALKVRRSGQLVSTDDVARARAAGADDQAIHDTVLIAAAFCMYNRYVDGLATWQPKEDEMYVEVGLRLARHGYVSGVPRPPMVRAAASSTNAAPTPAATTTTA